jgi:hypothetical protein
VEKDTAIGYPADDYRLVQQWLWYHMNDGKGIDTPNPLVNLNAQGLPTSLTSIGQAFKAQVAASDVRPNLALTAVHNAVISGTTSATLSAVIVNNGNAPTANSFKVSFYEDAGRSNLIGEETVSANFPGCGREQMTVSVTWNGLTPGSKDQFWVFVDTGASVDEIDNAGDNIGSGEVWVDPAMQLFLPFTKP